MIPKPAASLPLPQTAPSVDAYGGLADEPYTPQPMPEPAAPPLAADAPAFAEQPAAASFHDTADSAAGGLKMVSVELIEHNPNQPRQEFDPDEIRRLAESIAEHGLLQPVVVRRVDDHYQLIAGERRFRAAKQAGWVDVPVNVIDADDRQSAELAIVENLQRKDLNALEKAASFQRYLQEYGCTQDELAGRLKLDRSTIANLIRLLELPESVQDAIRRGKITPGHARALLPLGDEREQTAFCERIQKEGLNVRQTEEVVQQTIAEADRTGLNVVVRDGGQTTPRRRQSEHLAALEQEFRAALGLRVKITHNARGRGKLVVHFANHDEFEQLRAQFCGPATSIAKKHAG
jgi:ParB family transcriptional regulator, chromosome partitioning protein